MDIPLVNTAPACAPGIVTPITPMQVQATVQAQSAALLVAQTTVDLSPLGRFLSAVALFQKRMLELQSNPAAVAAEQASEEESISPLALAVADLAASANALQASSITGTSDDQSLATLFGQQMAAQAGLEDDTDDAGLSAIGLTFGSASGLDDGDVLNVDTAVLQAAFATDPVATTALLSRTATAFGALAGIAPAESASADPAVVFTDEPGSPSQRSSRERSRRRQGSCGARPIFPAMLPFFRNCWPTRPGQPWPWSKLRRPKWPKPSPISKPGV